MNPQALALKLLPPMIEWRRYLHRRPETSWRECETSAWLVERLRSFGLTPRVVAANGILVDIAGERPGPRLAFRAELDALAITEQTGLSFASEMPGKMHACGHDAHMAMLLGAAKGLAENRNEFAGVVRLLFQPAEETPPSGTSQPASTGAVLMVSEGAMDGVAAVFGLHGMPQLPCGQIGLRRGAIMAGSGSFEIVVHGKGGHAGMPTGTVDALAVAAQMVTGLRAGAMLGENPTSPLVIHIGTLQAGATATAVAAQAHLTGTIRFIDPARQAALENKVRQTAEHIAAAFGARADVSFFDHRNAPVINDRRLVDELASLAVGMNVIEPEPLMAAEDFWAYLEKAPGAYIFLGVGDPAKAENPGLHSPLFELDEKALAVGLELWLRIARDAQRFVIS